MRIRIAGFLSVALGIGTAAALSLLATGAAQDNDRPVQGQDRDAGSIEREIRSSESVIGVTILEVGTNDQDGEQAIASAPSVVEVGQPGESGDFAKGIVVVRQSGLMETFSRPR